MSDHAFLPLVENGPSAPPVGGPSRLVIDPITRIEGHLRIEVQIENGQVKDAWSSSTMFRGIETILQGRDPRDAAMITQRVCGVCTTVHSIAAVRAVENALGITVPDNARILRNLLEGAQFIQDHVIHFYHLHALDWVDIVSATQADPAGTSSLQKSLSDWPNNTPEYFAGVKTRLQNFVASGQLGLFANGYWGHPAYKLPAEVNLLAAAHYLEALDWQRSIIKIQAILGGKNPHPSVYVVGGMSSALDPGNTALVDINRLNDISALINQASDFVNKVYLPDLLAIASFYKDWAGIGGGPGNFLAFGDFPTAGNDMASYWMPQGVVLNKNIGKHPAGMDQNQIAEYVTHSWYTYSGGDGVGKYPTRDQGETTPHYTGPQPPYDYLNVDGKYSWLKAPRYQDTVMEVGALARVLVAYAAGKSDVVAAVNSTLNTLKVGADALFSTLGRTAARGIETQLVAGQMSGWLQQLADNMETKHDLTIANTQKWDPATWPADCTGWGTTEAPRGALGHWVHINKGKIMSYQMVVPTTWNGSPRDERGQRGAWEQALIGTPVADPARPVEILRTIHSFDPCMACAVHLIDERERPLTRVEVY
jgi:Ni,Fe-hydrogenase I large subunit